MYINLNSVPWHAVGGGLMIGSAVALLLLFNGRIAGISGIVGGLYRMQKGDIGWRVTFILGLILSVVIWKFFFVLPEIAIETNYTMLALAGFLVGYGTRLGSGCTSGHGVCGISRRSPRSIAATIVFMLAGFMTVYLIRHVFTF
ncbi:YeeE/YedE family protein [Nitrosomonas sp.]|uniref:YeeE/YedE family protein n=1 Tax=Nitrosomonas sp. TaxID=42353 RepID=UPI0025D4481C|nr:YeeE/YedE family protein [Nitrosomonas sp.]MBY0485507.1 YeeE/YedE family protein [Nitrosomonas sp.]